MKNTTGQEIINEKRIQRINLLVNKNKILNLDAPITFRIPISFFLFEARKEENAIIPSSEIRIATKTKNFSTYPKLLSVR